MKGRRALAIALAFSSGSVAQAKVIEEQFDVPVEVKNAWGKVVAHPIRVTMFVDDATPAPRPILLIGHGRSAEAEGRASMGRARYSEVSRWFARRGFAVAVPTRVGYGVTGGEDVEDSGTCSKKNYPPVYAAAAVQTLAVLDAVRGRPDTQKDRSVVLGQSFGGTTAIAVAGLNPAGVVAAINFAGGGGGNPKTQPMRPCATPELESLFAGYGRTARIPTLWVYTENDMYFGADYPREWFHAFSRKGGVGKFVQFPPHGEDGHSLFTRFPQVWQPVVTEFLRGQGFALHEAASAFDAGATRD